MKKSLSLLLSFALVFGLFASMASAADTQLTTAEKYKVLVDKGVLKGTTTNDDGLGDNLNRAQFATIAVALAGLQAEKPATATFTDVKSSEWWYGAIEAAAKAGLVEGTGAGKFSPRADVTVESVIKIAVTIAKIEPVKDAKVEGASDWAGPYVQAALDKGLIPAGLDYKSNATRGQSIDVVYPVYLIANQVEPAKVSVTSAKASGVKKVEVVLDKAVDTAKATFTLKKGTVNVALDTVKWSDDKKTATLPLKDVKITDGAYTVTLAGVEDIEKATAEFTGQKEELKKIEFVTSSEEIVRSTKAKLKLRTENQYGELASYGASNYTINAGNLTSSLKLDSEGYLIATIDTETNIQQGNYVPVFVYFDETRVAANQSFRVGSPPFVKKLELGKLTYADGKEAISKIGDSATVVLNLFDQYGNPVTPEQNVSGINIFTAIAPYTDTLETAYDDITDDTYRVKISVAANKKIEKAGDYTLTVNTGAGTATTQFKVTSSKVAVGVKIGDLEGTLAAGDSNRYITLDVTDANGDTLTAQEIADNASRIQISGGSAATATVDTEIVKAGKHKGKVRIISANINAGNQSVYVSAAIMTPNANSYHNKSFKIEPKRVPESFEVKEKPAVKAVLGATSNFEVIVKDQYGEKISSYAPTQANDRVYKIGAKLVNATGVTTTVYGKGTNAGTALSGTELDYASADFGKFNDGFTFGTNGAETGTSKVEFVLYSSTATNPTTANAPIASTSVSIQSIASTDTNLNYSLKAIGDIFSAKDYSDSVVTPAQKIVASSKLAKQVEVVVTDASGNKVAFPDNRISYVTVSSLNQLETAQGAGADAHKWFVMGFKPGAATVSAIVTAADGTTKNLTAAANVKADLPKVASISAKDENTVTFGSAVNVYTLLDLKVKDQYGVEYAGMTAHDYKNLLGVTFTISDIVGTGTVTLDHATGAITISANTVKGFVVTAVSPDGSVSATTPIVVN